MARQNGNESVKVLVVDDDPDVCRYLQSLLTTNGFTAQYTTDPTTVISKIKEEMFQIIILDLIMPGISGIELLKEIRRIDNHMCVIVLSGYASFDNAVQVFKNDAFDFVAKPFEKSHVLQSLKNATKHYGFLSDLSKRASRQIAAHLRGLRVEGNFSYRQLASRAGLSPSLVYQIEHGRTSPSLATVSRLATALRTPLESFFKGL